jgi:hypothetical protein
MYTCTERDRTKNQRIKRGYKGTESVGGKGESDMERWRKWGSGGNEKGCSKVTRDEG